MDLLSQWQELVESTTKQSWSAYVHETREGIKTLPFYFGQEQGVSCIAKNPHELFKNILPPNDPIWKDEFASYPGAAVELVAEDDLGKIPDSVKCIFFNHQRWWSRQAVEQILANYSTDKDLNLGWDPLGRHLHHGKMVRWGENYFPVELFAIEDRPQVKAFRFSSELYSLAGASTVQELGILLASVVECYRLYQDRLELKKLAKLITVELSLSMDTLWNVAKVQALRSLLARLHECYEITDVEIPILTCPSLRYFSSREPWNNLVRLTLMQAAAMMGGASGFRHYPFDVFNIKSQEWGRLSRNISLILQNESGLGFITNPTEGSGVMAHWLDQMCEKSWLCMQEIERKGGLTSSLQSGWIQEEIHHSHESEWERVKKSQRRLIGVNQYVNLEKLSEQFIFAKRDNIISVLDWWENKTPSEKLAKQFDVKPLIPIQLAKPFEDLQILSDEELARSGRRPHLYVYCPKPEANGEKIKWLKEVAQTAGFKLQIDKQVQKTEWNVACCIGGDPEADIWPEAVSQLRSFGYDKIIWIGEKQHKLFDASWSLKSEKFNIASVMHRWSGVKYDA